jgi:hypothetical protein
VRLPTDLGLADLRQGFLFDGRLGVREAQIEIEVSGPTLCAEGSVGSADSERRPVFTR